jgi:hypothetical protein
VQYEPSTAVYRDLRARLGEWLARKSFYGSSAHPLSQGHGGTSRRRRLRLGVLGWGSHCLGSGGGLCRWPCSSRLLPEYGSRLDSVGVSTRTAWQPDSPCRMCPHRSARRARCSFEYVRTRPLLDPMRFALGCRLDDLPFGAAVWWKAIKGRSLGELLPTLRAIGARGPDPGTRSTWGPQLRGLDGDARPGGPEGIREDKRSHHDYGAHQAAGDAREPVIHLVLLSSSRAPA